MRAVRRAKDALLFGANSWSRGRIAPREWSECDSEQGRKGGKGLVPCPANEESTNLVREGELARAGQVGGGWLMQPEIYCARPSVSGGGAHRNDASLRSSRLVRGDLVNGDLDSSA